MFNTTKEILETIFFSSSASSLSNELNRKFYWSLQNFYKSIFYSLQPYHRLFYANFSNVNSKSYTSALLGGSKKFENIWLTKNRMWHLAEQKSAWRLKKKK